MLNRTSIEWVQNDDGSLGFSWNPVTGCLNNCSYCYARDITHRFGNKAGLKLENHLVKVGQRPVFECTWKEYKEAGVFPRGFLPTFYEHRLNEPLRRRKQATIFVCSMGELFGPWVLRKWIDEIVRIANSSIHRYIFLTKFPARMDDFTSAGGWGRESRKRFHIHRAGPWLGITITGIAGRDHWVKHLLEISKWGLDTFISFEPLLGPAEGAVFPGLKWVIIGALTKNGKPIRESIKLDWVTDIIRMANRYSIPVFLKDSILKLFWEYKEKRLVPCRQEVPWVPKRRWRCQSCGFKSTELTNYVLNGPATGHRDIVLCTDCQRRFYETIGSRRPGR